MNILDYIKKNGSKEILELNNVDALVFSRLVYLHLEKIEDKLPMSIYELKKYLSIMKNNKYDTELILLLSSSIRYKNILLNRFQSILDEKKEEQFAALTIKFKPNNLFVAYRGTTKNLIAYKEDLNMSYKIVPAQIDALNYLNKENGFNNLYLGGHSKGGNLSMYAGINANFSKRVMIKKIYNFDGPGFLEITNKFKRMSSKIINFIPETSIFGELMYNNTSKQVIKSSKKGIEAHNIYTWQIENQNFIKGFLSNDSQEFAYISLSVLEKISKEKKKIIIDYVFEILGKSNIKSIKDITLNDFKKIISDIPRLNKLEKEELIKMVKAFLKLAFPI